MSVASTLLILVIICVMMASQGSVSIPSEPVIKKGNLVATLPCWGYYYTVSLKLKVKSWPSDELGWANVFRFQATDSPGDRIPVLQTYKEGKIQITNANTRDVSTSIPLDEWTDVIIQQSHLGSQGPREVIYEVFVDGVNIIRETNDKPTLYQNVKLWVSSTYLPAADALIKDFKIITCNSCDGNFTVGAVASNTGTYECPRSLTYGGGTQQYRFVEHIDSLPPPQYLPCVGDIDKCVYTAHHKFYCMNGNKPDYTPIEVNHHHPGPGGPAITNVSTYAGIFDVNGTFCSTPTNEPIMSIKLFPNAYGRRLVWGGFIVKTLTSGGGVATYRCGFTDQLPYVGPTWAYLELGDEITEVFGWLGAVINQVTFVVTNPVNPPRLISVGGINGRSFDQTPDPSIYGICTLIGIRVQTTTNFGGTDPAYIKAAEFYWQCVQ